MYADCIPSGTVACILLASIRVDRDKTMQYLLFHNSAILMLKEEEIQKNSSLPKS